MHREIVYLKEKDIVQITTSGIYVLSEEVEILKTMVAKMKEHHCRRVVFDHRKTDVIAKIVESYERSNLYEELVGTYNVSAAIIFKELTAENRFYETAVRNRGWNVRIFDNYDKGIEWLTK